MKQNLANGIIYTFAVIGFFSTLWIIPQFLHSRTCPACQAHAEWDRENGCAWFWCNHYNGK